MQLISGDFLFICLFAMLYLSLKIFNGKNYYIYRLLQSFLIFLESLHL